MFLLSFITNNIDLCSSLDSCDWLDAMKWCQLLTVILCAVTITSGQQSEFIRKVAGFIILNIPTVSLSLGYTGTRITTDNTEIFITDIGEGEDVPTRLTCHTDLTECCRGGDHSGSGGLGHWTYPDGSVIPNNAGGQDFFINRDAPQVIHLNSRENRHLLSPTGSYCCTVPTTGGDMTLCVNMGE